MRWASWGVPGFGELQLRAETEPPGRVDVPCSCSSVNVGRRDERRTRDRVSHSAMREEEVVCLCCGACRSAHLCSFLTTVISWVSEQTRRKQY